jgi:hypothetical protein
LKILSAGKTKISRSDFSSGFKNCRAKTASSLDGKRNSAAWCKTLNIEPMTGNTDLFPAMGEFVCPPKIKLLLGRPRDGITAARPNGNRKLIPNSTLSGSHGGTGLGANPSGCDDLEQKEPCTKREYVQLETSHSIGGTWMVYSPEDAMSTFFKCSEPNTNTTRDLKRVSKGVSSRNRKKWFASGN